MKNAKILSIDEDNLHLIIDARISIPRSEMSDEVFIDILQMKEKLINGAEKFEYRLSIDSENDKNILIFNKILKAPVA